uniref:Uncharacterized protein n=1 Tax=Glossina pallidipes TaxID=7398 RepID=A0A1A9ZQQ4_GLOPL
MGILRFSLGGCTIVFVCGTCFKALLGRGGLPTILSDFSNLFAGYASEVLVLSALIGNLPRQFNCMPSMRSPGFKVSLLSELKDEVERERLKMSKKRSKEKFSHTTTVQVEMHRVYKRTLAEGRGAFNSPEFFTTPLRVIASAEVKR